MFENLKKIIEESVSQALAEAGYQSGLTDANGKNVVTGSMVRPVNKDDKRWGRIAGVTIDLKVRVEWLDPESKYSGQKETAEDPKKLEIY